jgi:hypothetical protein
MMEAFKSAFDLAGSLADYKNIREELFAIKKQVKEHCDQGLPPAEIEGARGLLAACEAAEALADELFSDNPT